MSWKKPDFEEIALCMEVTAYVNTEEELLLPMGGEQLQASDHSVVNKLPDE